MYIVFNGYVKDYNKITISKVIKNIIPESEYIKEGGIDIERRLILETKEFPVDFDNDGNLIIKNYKKLNFEEEYSKSHKLLMLYANHENLEGIKYELSKLWFMNIVLEKRIYSNPTEEELQKYTKVRARILNDFNKYLNFVLEKEPNFNFTEYYNKSPFSDVDIKISGTLLNNLVNLLGQLL
jgi:leucyl-tRNA synthetase